MRVLLKIVYRNLKEHTTKTLIIGLIIAFGACVLIVGNSVVDTTTAGISANFIEYNTGHIAVFPAEIDDPSLVQGGPGQGGAGPIANGDVVPILPDYGSIVETIRRTDRVVAVSPQINGAATLRIEGEGSGFTQLLAVDPDAYRDFFPDNITLLAGRFLEHDEEGVVLSQATARMLGESSSRPPSVGDQLLLTATNAVSGIKIREVPIIGIYEAPIATQLLTSYVDSNTLRVLNGMTSITDVAAALTEKEQELLGSVSEDDLFGGSGDLFADITEGDRAGIRADETVDPLFAGLTGTEERKRLAAVDMNAWHYLLVRLEEGAPIGRTVDTINEAFAEDGLEVRAYEWIDVAGQIAEMTAGLKLIFHGIIIMIAIVAIIIMMNTLVISVTERIGEIGTMRAIGAQKPFVRRMIVLETLIITVVFGGAGLLVGAVAVAVVGVAQIPAENMIVQLLAGGEVIRPVISSQSVLGSAIGILIAGVAASLYPAALALRIEPRQAMAGN